ncbi:hypothetical protein LEMLEM_LOCUS13883 [Lemmus lemmus]
MCTEAIQNMKVREGPDGWSMNLREQGNEWQKRNKARRLDSCTLKPDGGKGNLTDSGFWDSSLFLGDCAPGSS